MMWINLQGGKHGKVDQAGVGAEHAGVGGAAELAREVGRAGEQVGGIRDGRREHLGDGLVRRGQRRLGGGIPPTGRRSCRRCRPSSSRHYSWRPWPGWASRWGRQLRWRERADGAVRST